MKYPIGIQTFEQIREGNYVYVDKTDLIYSLVSEGKIYFLSRPRRFGKSLLISTLENYFLGRKELFQGLAIEKLEKDWKQYPVFHFDFGTGMYINSDAMDQVLESHLAEWETKYHIMPTNITDYSLRFKKILEVAHCQTGLRAVVLIDEYDTPLLDVMDLDYKIDYQGEKISLEEYNRNTLKAFYSTFKAADKDLQFVFLTGVTKFSQECFGQACDISLYTKYEALCGITNEEMIQVFHEPIEKLALYYQCSFDDMVEKLNYQYGGYHFSDKFTSLFNPYSLYNAFQELCLGEYWFVTGNVTHMSHILSSVESSLDNVINKYYLPNDFDGDIANTQFPVPIFLYQSGFLTLKDYKRDMGIYLLDFPNIEMKKVYAAFIKTLQIGKNVEP